MSRAAVTVGQCTVNYLGLVDRLPDDEEHELAEFSQQGGGAAATSAAALAVLGAPPRFVGKIADDHFGEFLRRGLEQLGVDLRYLVIERGRVSPFCFSVVEMGTGRRVAYRSGGNVRELTSEEVDVQEALTDSSVLLLDGHMLELQREFAAAAKARGITVVWDACDARGPVDEMLRHVDVLLASERFAMEVAPLSDFERSLEELRRLGPDTAIITLGDEGAVGQSGGDGFHREPALPIDVVDTSEVGHVYSGALVYAIVQRWPLPRAMRFASHAAGLRCRKLGARAGLPDLDEVLRSIEAHERAR